MNYKKDTKHGKYTVKNKAKYFGAKNPVYKSEWELKVFTMMDHNPYIIKWGYECMEVPYAHPFKCKFTLYYPDIYCHVKDIDGNSQQFLIEIKPAKMCVLPTKPKVPVTSKGIDGKRYKNALRRYQNDVADYTVNMAKWAAAQQWCLRHKVRWLILSDANSSKLFCPNKK